ncbi:hypothetical protein K474DRAFT_471813 [Panus rudis PR-1116 ss-1]|nr:hypothetical protein K474DRAFT_471813 [Panus rudis PR-1116 ss-1]
MGKLRLKRTAAEQAEHDLKKARKRARKARQHIEETYTLDDPYNQDNDDTSYGPPPPSSSQIHHSTHNSYSSTGHKPDYDQIAAEVEEARFREKMWGAFEDDERLDAMEARMNDYAHVPRRWRGGGMERMDDELGIDPRDMEEEDYAEWVRVGMWRRKHKDEFEAQQRAEEERKRRKEREEAAREQTRRLEREAQEERRRRRHEKKYKRWKEAREQYDLRWKDLLDTNRSQSKASAELSFDDIPWPIFPSSTSSSTASTLAFTYHHDDFTLSAISEFLLPSQRDEEEVGPVPASEEKKARKDKLRETMLRFHPDKFEGRILRRVKEKDRDKVREAVGKVAVAINSLMDADS